MYNLIEYGDNCSKTSGSLWQWYRDEPGLTNAGAITSFSTADNTVSFKEISYWWYKKCWKNGSIKIFK